MPLLSRFNCPQNENNDLLEVVNCPQNENNDLLGSIHCPQNENRCISESAVVPNGGQIAPSTSLIGPFFTKSRGDSTFEDICELVNDPTDIVNVVSGLEL